ncbi:MAG: DUF485 domain-containing protein, partial [Planctomycetota bacterium]
VNTFAANTVEWEPIPGLNLAVLGGFGLIIGAFVLAMIYGYACVSETSDASSSEIESNAGGES